MSKSVLISINPKWCELIANGKKTVEIRKTKPKIDVPFKCYIYQTKAKDKLVEVMKDGDSLYGETYHGEPVFIKTFGKYHWDKGNGKVIGEFVCDSINEFNISGLEWWKMKDHLLNISCLQEAELKSYIGDKIGYSWHITDLVIYDKPKELSEFKCAEYHYGNIHLPPRPITRPPQSWQFVEEVQGDE